MDNLEQHLFSSGNPLIQSEFYWHRYVDDVICALNGTERQMNNFLKILNQMHPRITFTLETAEEGVLNFLDLKISVKNNRHHFEIFRKDTYTNHTIPADSRHHPSHKLAPFHSLIHRLFEIPLSPKDFSKEVRTIKQIASCNGFPETIVDRLIAKQRKRRSCERIYGSKDKEAPLRRCSLRFLGTKTMQVARHFPKEKLRVTYRPPLKIGDLLRNGKDKVDASERSGVYQLTCDDCQGVYTGQTGRSFSTRRKEHEAAFRNNHPENSQMANHLLKNGHQCKWNMKYLHFEKKGFSLNSLEQLEILKSLSCPNKLIINDNLFPSHSPILSAAVKIICPPPPQTNQSTNINHPSTPPPPEPPL